MNDGLCAGLADAPMRVRDVVAWRHALDEAPKEWLSKRGHHVATAASHYYGSKRGEMFVSLRTLAKNTRMSRNTVRGGIADAIAAGYLIAPYGIESSGTTAPTFWLSVPSLAAVSEPYRRALESGGSGNEPLDGVVVSAAGSPVEPQSGIAADLVGSGVAQTGQDGGSTHQPGGSAGEPKEAKRAQGGKGQQTAERDYTDEHWIEACRKADGRIATGYNGDRDRLAEKIYREDTADLTARIQTRKEHERREQQQRRIDACDLCTSDGYHIDETTNTSYLCDHASEQLDLPAGKPFAAPAYEGARS